ncbi:VOC family protein [Pseudomonas sp. LPB0260]|uniref:2-oxoadipate dioxygenase/decarboxylase HglS n=1 Tax=Pseudomonas sp. LPB0260 TaxID=2614442 RepID=UPI0015C28549|nr:VOC family protein [Pseudomonas sp. LPB0260]QLC72476.1 VOC family protein [Pseudomonas sp. LPB0260]QLC75252.1 VOC family protein [Pseudomonas sp. LPB0260]
MSVQAAANPDALVSPDEIRAQFSRAMSAMYQAEVPLYGALLELVGEVNAQTLAQDRQLAARLSATGEIQRLDMERHGAIRLGSAAELATMRRLFAVMGMYPVGYYDLACAGVPVHSTAFRATHEASLQHSPFRVFTSLLRLELIENRELRELAAGILARRNIFTPRALQLIERAEAAGGLNAGEADEFVQQALETFRWHREATVGAALYQQLSDQHRLIADVVAFKGPHINHLTPRTLDIDAVQAGMQGRGISPKAVIEGPPPRRCPILLRQTSFKALQEAVTFVEADGSGALGSHTARFGEIEQRGVALTPRGRALYDRLLEATRKVAGGAPNEEGAAAYMATLSQQFQAFPDDYASLRRQGLAYFRYFVTEQGLAAKARGELAQELEALLAAGHLQCEPLVYEDFLPVSAAGIFQSNLGDNARDSYGASANREAFERDLGAPVLDELALYAETQQRSLAQCAEALGLPALA